MVNHSFQMLKSSPMQDGVSLLLFMPHPFFEETAACLRGHDMRHASTYLEADAALKARRPDAVIAASNPEVVSFFETIRAVFPEPSRPLLLLISADFSESSPLADAVLPLAVLPGQVKAMLEMRTRQIEWFNQCQMLTEENEHLKTALREGQKAKSEVEILKNAIVRNVSHELRTPLLQVKSAVSLLAEDVKDTQLIDYATGATARLEMIVKNITMLGGILENEHGPVIVRDTMEYVRRSLRRVWEHRDHTTRIKIDLPTNLPPVLADKQGLSTVLQLLIDNALKFSKDDIEVSARKEGKFITISVRDYGIGIAPDQINRIFDSFYQIDATETRSYGGMGVGLAIVRLILDNHHTRVHVESVLGEGSTFSFTLPMVDF
jgi:signal transduction histidine kinase